MWWIKRKHQICRSPIGIPELGEGVVRAGPGASGSAVKARAAAESLPRWTRDAARRARAVSLVWSASRDGAVCATAAAASRRRSAHLPALKDRSVGQARAAHVFHRVRGKATCAAQCRTVSNRALRHPGLRGERLVASRRAVRCGKHPGCGGCRVQQDEATRVRGNPRECF